VVARVHNLGEVPEAIRRPASSRSTRPPARARPGSAATRATDGARAGGRLALQPTRLGTSLVVRSEGRAGQRGPGAADEAAAEAEALEHARGRAAAASVLVVDDERFNCLVLRRSLPTPPPGSPPPGKRPRRLEAAERDWPDAVLMLDSRSGMDGYEARRACARLEKKAGASAATHRHLPLNDVRAPIARARGGLRRYLGRRPAQRFAPAFLLHRAQAAPPPRSRPITGISRSAARVGPSRLGRLERGAALTAVASRSGGVGSERRSTRQLELVGRRPPAPRAAAARRRASRAPPPPQPPRRPPPGPRCRAASAAPTSEFQALVGMQAELALLHARHQLRRVAAEAQARALCRAVAYFWKKRSRDPPRAPRTGCAPARPPSSSSRSNQNRPWLRSGAASDPVLHQVGEHRVAGSSSPRRQDCSFV